MKKSKLMALLLAAVMVFALAVTGCSGGGESAGGGAASGGGTTGGATEPAGGGDAPAAPAGDKEEILVGYVAPFTGPLSCFVVAYDWVEDQCLEVINQEGGIYIESYGKNLPVRVITGDSESDPTKATEVATKMVLDDKVDILMGAWTPDTTSPVSAVAERYSVPALMVNTPADSWLTGGPFEWATGIMFYQDGMLSDYIDAWDKLDTNKKVGYIFDSEVDGVTMSAKMNELLPGRGYEIVDPGRFPSTTTDYTNIITQLKNAGCDIIVANQITPAFTTCWQQFFQLGYIPKVMTIGKAEHFDTDVVALGEGYGEGLMSEVLWDRSFPFTSPLLNISCEDICAKWEAEKGTQFPATIGYDVSGFEVLQDALSRCKDLEPATIRDAILATDIDSIYGHLSFDENNVAAVPCVTCQWVKGETWEYEKTIVGAGSFDVIATVDPIYIPNHN